MEKAQIMGRRHPRVYALLRRQGHSPLKSLQIMFDAKRGNAFSLLWIRRLRILESRRGAAVRAALLGGTVHG